MDTSKSRRRNNWYSQHRKTDSRKIVGRLTYNPLKHKQKVTKELREKLQKKPTNTKNPVVPSPRLKFGSFNVNGLDVEGAWAIEQLLKRKGFDVSIKYFLNEI